MIRKHSNDLTQKIINKLPVLVAVYSVKSGEYIYVNDAIKKILGYSKEEFIQGGLNFVSSLIHPDDYPMLMEKNLQALKLINNISRTQDRDPIVDFEYRMKHKNNSWRWLKSDGVVFGRDKKGDVEYIMNISIDITSRKQAEIKETTNRQQAETKLLSSEQKFRKIWESVFEAIVITDDQGVVLDANPQYFKLTGYTKSQLIGKSFTKLYLVQDRKENKRLYDQVFQNNQEIESIESKIRRSDGKEVVIESQHGFINLEGQKVMVSTIRDISIRKKLEKQKDQFIAIASHELKTPVTSIKAYTQVLKHNFEQKGDLASAKLLSKMDFQLNKLNNLIKDLLDISKIESGQINFNETNFAIDDLVEEIVESIQFISTTHQLKIKGKTHEIVHADKERIGQVMTNLLANAIRYSPRSKKVIITLQSDRKFVTVGIQDFGIGIDKKSLDKVFQRFYRVNDSIQSDQETYPGLGLGLFISSEIIKHQKGRIWVESKKGQGSRFYFTVPIAKV